MDIVRPIVVAVMLVGNLLWVSAPLFGQARSPEEPPVLHAYANLVQIPVLVLAGNRLRAHPLSQQDFRLSIDSGPMFEPRHVRREGLDAINLAVLVDVSPNTRKALAGLADALPDLAVSLTENDRVSLTLLQGCSTARTEDVPGDLLWLRRLGAFVTAELERTGNAAQAQPCAGGLRLRDASLLAVEKLMTGNARRVLLVMTDGLADRSSTSLQQLRFAAGATGVSIFALREQTEEAAKGNIFVLNRDAFAFAAPRTRDGSIDALVALTEWAGGTTLETRGHPLGESLTRIMRLIRERYIVEFVRPEKLQEGQHSVEVRLRDGGLFATSAGVGLPSINPGVANDPNTVPSDASRQPPIGTRRVVPR